ncbi:2557_t:CDS:2 [Ambispora gerdemannii]|uniref:2557_t:CDS:1 n=1 Tax=Ambispora gerdemannii TaxID=144530 RepID=A0A9N9BZ55_9GLOM|nr:2557_t:CDS:2 [Ambispora gerdemannii]
MTEKYPTAVDELTKFRQLSLVSPILPPTESSKLPSKMTAWCYCIDNRTTFRKIDPTKCLYNGMPSTFQLPTPPLLNLIAIDLYAVRRAVLSSIIE